jgi:cytochrome oxidase assembly protein ShyY1
MWLQVTPVYSSDGKRAILVRRGWVPDTWRRQHSTQAHTSPANPSSVSTSSTSRSWWWFSRSRKAPAAPEVAHALGVGGVGVVSRGEVGNSLTFANEPETGSWNWLDAASMVLCSFSSIMYKLRLFWGHPGNFCFMLLHVGLSYAREHLDKCSLVK